MKYYISDTHFGHEKCIMYDHRPFSNVDEMTESLINIWNSTVSDDDEIYILGDFAWKKAVGLMVLQRLRGQKYLIKGNHDHWTEEMKDYFVWIKDYAEIKDEDRMVILCHYPIAHWRDSDRGSIHLYGHIHASRDSRPYGEYCKMMRAMGVRYECYNVGCMLPYMGYAPRTLNEIVAANMTGNEPE